MVSETIKMLKIAGGDITDSGKQETGSFPDSKPRWCELRQCIAPGYALLERRDVMVNAMNSGMDAMEALLKYTTARFGADPGRHRISGTFPAGNSEKCGAEGIPHRFAESVITLGNSGRWINCGILRICCGVITIYLTRTFICVSRENTINGKEKMTGFRNIPSVLSFSKTDPL